MIEFHSLFHSFCNTGTQINAVQGKAVHFDVNIFEQHELHSALHFVLPFALHYTTLQSYIQKRIKSADFAFQCKKSAEKVRKFSRPNFMAKVRKSSKLQEFGVKGHFC